MAWRTSLLFNNLHNWRVWILGLVSCILVAGAFQIPYTYSIDFGAATDRFFIQGGMYDAERDGDQTIRWTRGRATIMLPALTRGEWLLQLQVNGWQPKGAAKLDLSVGAAKYSTQTSSDWETWQRPLVTEAGDMPFVFDSNRFSPADYGNVDTRSVGVRFDSLTLAPGNFGLREPPLLEYVLPLTAAVMLCYLNLNLLSVRARYATAASGLALLGLVLLIGLYRNYLNTTVLFVTLAVLSGSLLFIVFGLDGLGAVYRKAGIKIAPRELNWLALIVLSVLAVKLVGVLYPQVYIIDAIFHLHRLEGVEQGDLFFVTRSREFASLETVYPPGLYITLLPLGVLAPDDLTLLKVAMPFIDALGALVLFWIACKSGLSVRAALFSVLLYLTVPIGFIVFGWGVYTNLFAQLLLILTIGAWFALPLQGRPILAIARFTFFLVVGLLAHASGIVLLVAFWGLVALGDYFLTKAPRRAALTVASLGLALLVAFALYFSVFVDKTLTNLSALAARSSNHTTAFERVVGGGLDDSALGLVPIRVHSWAEWMGQGALYLAHESLVYYCGVVVAAALLGVLLLWRRGSEFRLATITGAGILTVLLFFFVGLIFNLYVRYMLFGLPFFALGAGYVFELLWQKNPPGRAAVLGSFALIIGTSFLFWVNRVVQ